MGLVVISLCGTAQNGMDYAGQTTANYSRLRSNFPLQQQSARNEKALGVFQSNITPQSFLEVNSTPAYMPFPMGSIALGEVFRTTSPNANNAAWRMFTGAGTTAQKFRITSLANSNNIEISTVQNGFMSFQTNNTQRMFIKNNINNYPNGNNAGYVSIGNPPAAAPLFNLSVLTQSVGAGDFLIGGTTSKSPTALLA